MFAFVIVMAYCELAVDAATTFVEDVTLQVIARAIINPDWAYIQKIISPNRWWVPYALAFAITVCFVIVRNRSVRLWCSALGALTIPTIGLVAYGLKGLLAVVVGPWILLRAWCGLEDGETWSDGFVMIGSLSVWSFTWLIVILPCENVRHRRERAAG